MNFNENLDKLLKTPVNQPDHEREKERRLIKIKYSTPDDYINARAENIDKRIINSKAKFIWICGKQGRGKTWSIYALKNQAILDGYEFNVKKEYELNRKTRPGEINAIDDLGLSTDDDYNRKILDVYFSIFDYFSEHKRRLYITSNKTANEWLNYMRPFNDEMVPRITSRLTKSIEEIELIGNDKRRV